MASRSITTLSDAELIEAGVSPADLKLPGYVKRAPLLEDVEYFDASFFGYTPTEALKMDPQQRVFLECAWEALEHAGYDPLTYQGQVGVFAGAKTNGYILQLCPGRSSDELDLQVMLGTDLAFLSTRTAYKLNLRGPSYTIQTACSTSLVAVHLACQSLLNYECGLALAGGVAINVPHRVGYFYQEGDITSPDGHCSVRSMPRRRERCLEAALGSWRSSGYKMLWRTATRSTPW